MDNFFNQAPSHFAPNGSQAEAQPINGRYRFCAGQPMESSECPPTAPLHPEMQTDGVLVMASIGVPDSPAQLLAMQENTGLPRREKGTPFPNAKVKKLLELLDTLEVDPADDLDLATRLVRRLEAYHDKVVVWAIDADRLMRSRILLESINLD